MQSRFQKVAFGFRLRTALFPNINSNTSTMFGGLLHSNHLRRGVLSRPWPLKRERPGRREPRSATFAFRVSECCPGKRVSKTSRINAPALYKHPASGAARFAIDRLASPPPVHASQLPPFEGGRVSFRGGQAGSFGREGFFSRTQTSPSSKRERPPGPGDPLSVGCSAGAGDCSPPPGHPRIRPHSVPVRKRRPRPVRAVAGVR